MHLQEDCVIMIICSLPRPDALAHPYPRILPPKPTLKTKLTVNI